MNIFTDVIIPIVSNTVKQLIPFLPFFIFFVCVSIAAFIIFNHFYKKGTYYKITGNPYIVTRLDLGKYGEYLTYKELRNLEYGGGRFLFNVYVPKEYDETSEIDVMLICKYGIFVFESKNYSGWIFGSEDQPYWTQTLPKDKDKGRSNKERFYNPIKQNKSHIKHLKNLIGENIPTHSVIVFSNRCTLKNVTVNSGIPVVNRSEVYNIVASVCRNSAEVLNEEQIEKLYGMLYPFAQVDEEAKADHISRIKGGKPNTAPTETKEATPSVSDENPEKPADESPICPKCGSKLVFRTAKRGENAGKQFYGCSEYPKCKYTRDI